MSADKDVDQCVALVRQLAPASHVYCTQAEHPRALSRESLRRLLADGSVAAECTYETNDGSVREVLARALLDSASSGGEWTAEAVADVTVAVRPLDAAGAASDVVSATPPALVVVCGTAFIMAEARAALGLREPRDTVHFHATYSFSSPGGGAAVWRDMQEHFAGTDAGRTISLPTPSTD